MKKIKKVMTLSMSKGFTLVELLIVIALLGALAIGLIGALDPFEQLKKGTDTGTRNVVSEVHSAIIRYYALKGYMPWCTSSGEENCEETPDEDSLSGNIMEPALSKIIVTGELKSNFETINSGELGKVFVSGTPSDVFVCYQPTSKSFLSDANTKYLKDGTEEETPSECNTSTHKCYWCVK